MAARRTPLAKIRVTDLVVGQFFKNRQWQQVVELETPERPMTARGRDGVVWPCALYMTYVEVLPLGEWPSTWSPSALRRSAETLRAQGNRLIRLAADFAVMAIEIEESRQKG